MFVRTQHQLGSSRAYQKHNSMEVELHFKSHSCNLACFLGDSVGRGSTIFDLYPAPYMYSMEVFEFRERALDKHCDTHSHPSGSIVSF